MRKINLKKQNLFSLKVSLISFILFITIISVYQLIAPLTVKEPNPVAFNEYDISQEDIQQLEKNINQLEKEISFKKMNLEILKNELDKKTILLEQVMKWDQKDTVPANSNIK